MTYIPPTSVIQFFGDLGISPNYENTLYFATEASKDAYFSNMPRVAQATQVTYTREERGYVRVQIPMSEILLKQLKGTTCRWTSLILKLGNHDD